MKTKQFKKAAGASSLFLMHVLVLAAWLEAKYRHATELKAKSMIVEETMSDVEASEAAAGTVSTTREGGISALPSTHASIVHIDAEVFWKKAQRDLQLRNPVMLAYALLVGHTMDETATLPLASDEEQTQLALLGQHAQIRPQVVLSAWLRFQSSRTVTEVRTFTHDPVTERSERIPQPVPTAASSVVASSSSNPSAQSHEPSLLFAATSLHRTLTLLLQPSGTASSVATYELLSAQCKSLVSHVDDAARNCRDHGVPSAASTQPSSQMIATRKQGNERRRIVPTPG